MFYVEWVLMSDTRACSNLQSAVCNMASVTPTGATCARKYRRNTRERPLCIISMPRKVRQKGKLVQKNNDDPEENYHHILKDTKYGDTDLQRSSRSKGLI